MDKIHLERNSLMLSSLLPEVRELAERHIALSGAEGIDLLVVYAYRSLPEQEKIYAKGRSGPGKVVTGAPPGHSWHNFRRAYDVAVLSGGRIDWQSDKYRRAGEIGRSLGLVWGGDFKAIKGDLGHFEYHPGLTLARARAVAGLA